MRTRRVSSVIAAALGSLGLLTACATSASLDHTTTHSRPIGTGLTGIGTLPAPASAWPASGYDARHSSATAAVGPQTAHVRWTRSLGGDLTPGPVISVDGSVVVSTTSGEVHALDPASGKDRWTVSLGGGGTDLSTSPAVLADGTILVPADRTLVALSTSGAVLWKQAFPARVLSPAIAGRGRIYVADMAGHLSAFTVAGAVHQQIWTTSFGGTDYASPTVSSDDIIYTASDKDVVAVRDLGAQGRVLWRFHAATSIEVSTAVSRTGTVLAGTNGDQEFGLDADGRITWSLGLGDYTYSSAVIRPEDELGYVGDNSGRLRVIDTTTGQIRRTITPMGTGKEKIWTQPVVDAKGDVYWATTAGNVWGYDASGRQLLHVHADSGINSYPALGRDGTLYLGSTGGTFYAVGG